MQVLELIIELQKRQGDLLKANTLAEFASAVRNITDQLSEADAGWTGLSETIRDSWGL